MIHKNDGDENKEIKLMIQEIGTHDEITKATLLNMDFSEIPDSGPDRLRDNQTFRWIVSSKFRGDNIKDFAKP